MITSVKRFYTLFVLFIPVLYAIAENTTGYFSGGSMNPGTIRGFITAIFLLIFLTKFYPKDGLNKTILFFVFYYFLLCFFSSNYSESFYGFFKFSIAMFMFPVGYFFINNYENFQKLNKFFFIALCLFLINIVVANIFNLGTSDYLEDSFYFGAGRVNITKIMLIVLFASVNLITVLNSKQKKFFIAILIISAFVTVVGIKRSVLLSFAAGAVLYLIFNRLRLGMIKIVFPVVFGILLTLLVYPNAINLIESRFLAREERIGLDEEVIESEGRVDEVSLVMKSWIEGGVVHKIFGSELFNDRAFFNSRRMLHTDYMVILNGSGILGIILWFAILFGIFIKGNKFLTFFDNDIRFPFLKATFYSILVSQLFMSISGSIQGIGLRSFILLYLGAIIGTIRGEYIQMRYLNIDK